MSTFGEILITESNKANVSYRQLWLKVSKLSKVSCSVFYDYISDSIVPSKERARIILNSLGIEYNDEELYQIIRETEIKRQTKMIRQKSRFDFVKAINLPLRKLSHILDSEIDIENAMNERVELCADSFSDYVCKLIQKDIDNHILEEKKKEK